MEEEIAYIGEHSGFGYLDIMSMPSSRRKRYANRIEERIKKQNADNKAAADRNRR